MAIDIQCCRKAGLKTVAAIFLAVAGCALPARPDTNDLFAARARAEFETAKIRYQSLTNDPAAAWQFARACFDLADFATNKSERAAIAAEGIAASRKLLVRWPQCAPGHYYLALNLGQLARTEMLGALKLVREMQREFKTADELDDDFDDAGAARGLGLLYREAPGWPTSIGSRRKAREWLERAVKLAPDNPENHLNLLESQLGWNDRAAAQAELKALETLWPKAQTNYVGVAWEQSWLDWTNRKNVAERALAKSADAAESSGNHH